MQAGAATDATDTRPILFGPHQHRTAGIASITINVKVGAAPVPLVAGTDNIILEALDPHGLTNLLSNVGSIAEGHSVGRT